MRKDEGMEIHRTLGFGVDKQCKLERTIKDIHVDTLFRDPSTSRILPNLCGMTNSVLIKVNVEDPKLQGPRDRRKSEPPTLW